MITLTLIESEKGKSKRTIAVFSSADKAKESIRKISKGKKAEIVAVSYDTDSEKALLVELGALRTSED